MKKSSSELKDLAKKLLSGHYGLLIGAVLLYGGVSIVISLILDSTFTKNNTFSVILYLVCSLIVGLLSTIFAVGYQKMVLDISRGQEPGLGTLLFGFSNQPDRIILLTILVGLITAVCVLPGSLLIGIGVILDFLPLTLIGFLALIAGLVAAIILYFSYSMVFYLYLDAPEKGVIQIMRESRVMMKGNKGRLFYLEISFIGLVLLSILTCFIGYLWLMPYMEMASVLFYRNLIGEIQ